MAQLYNVDSPINREQRNNINATFADIQNRFSNLGYQISILTGGQDLDAIIQSIQGVISSSTSTTQEAREAIDNVNTSLTELRTAIQNSETATDAANTAAQNALNEITELQNFVNQLGNANTYDNVTTYVLNNIVEYNGSSYIALQETTGNTPPALPTKRNAYWQLLAQRGVDGAGSVSSVASISPDVNGNVPLVAENVGAASTIQLEETNKDIDDLLQTSSSVFSFKTNNSYRAWQGVTAYNDLIYAATDRNESFGFENIISVYDLSGRLVRERRNAYTDTDPQGVFMSFGDINEINGMLYGTFYNKNSGGSPLLSRVVIFDPITLDVVSSHDIGGNVAESITLNNGSYWVVYNDVYVIREFDLSFNQINEYNLEMDPGYTDGGSQGHLWEDGILYVNLHGVNFFYETPFAQVRSYTFDGTSFTFQSSFQPPTPGCGQGISKYKKYYLWNDRITNEIVISKRIVSGNVSPVVKPNTISYTPPLRNGWVPLGNDANRTIRVTKVDDIVYLSGIVSNPNTSDVIYNGDGSTPITQIPAHLCPQYGYNFGALSSVGVIRLTIVGPETGFGIANPERIGNVVPQDISGLNQGGRIEWISFDSISYPTL